METIEDILDEIRDIADAGNGHLSIHAPTFASRIEAAWEIQLAAEKARAAGEGYAAGKQAVTNCNQLKMREALVKSRKAMDEMSMSIFQGWIEDGLAGVAGEAQKAISSALSAPPRNCDLYSTEEDAWQAFSSVRQGVDSSTEEYEKWLFAEAKGDAK